MTDLGLGCVQLGLPYGNASNAPLMAEREAHEILRVAAARGVRFFDTAAAYGESERRIGSSDIASGRYSTGEPLEISTKIPQTTKDVWSNEPRFRMFLDETIDASLKRLDTTSIGLLQFHQHDIEFIENPIVQKCMIGLLEEERCRQIGISVYQPEEASICCETSHISAIQVPVNLLDRRFFSSDLCKKYRSKRMVIIGRSLFLQAVLIETACIPDVARKRFLEHLRSLLTRELEDRSLFRMAVAFAKWGLEEWLNIALMGVDSLKSLETNLDAWQISAKSEYADLSTLDLGEAIQFAKDHDLLNPSTWNRPINV
jgi:aryl-alcohol dehydrogenase-like predicted oxidoreductase